MRDNAIYASTTETAGAGRGGVARERRVTDDEWRKAKRAGDLRQARGFPGRGKTEQGIRKKGINPRVYYICEAVVSLLRNERYSSLAVEELKLAASTTTVVRLLQKHQLYSS